MFKNNYSLKHMIA